MLNPPVLVALTLTSTVTLPAPVPLGRSAVRVEVLREAGRVSCRDVVLWYEGIRADVGMVTEVVLRMRVEVSGVREVG